jgi:hypothetical protein
MYTSHTYRTVCKLVQLLNRRFNPRLRKTSHAAPQATRVSHFPVSGKNHHLGAVGRSPRRDSDGSDVPQVYHDLHVNTNN